MYRFRLFLLFLIVGTGVYLFLRMPQATLTDKWLTYDGGTWSIEHPPSLTPTAKSASKLSSLNLVSFGGFTDASTVTIHIGAMTKDPIGELALQRDPNRSDIVGTVLQLEKESLRGFVGLKLVSAERKTINNYDAVEVIEVNSSNPTDSEYSAQTTFIHQDLLAFVSLFTSHSPQPADQTEQIYNSMLKSFRFK